MTLADKRLIKSAWQARSMAPEDQESAQLRVPDDLDMKGIRETLNLSQDDFAAVYGFTINQIRNWEQSRARPLGGLGAYLMLIKREPEIVGKILEEVRQEERTDAQSGTDDATVI